MFGKTLEKRGADILAPSAALKSQHNLAAPKFSPNFFQAFPWAG